jgi:hypothetical protein
MQWCDKQTHMLGTGQIQYNLEKSTLVQEPEWESYIQMIGLQHSGTMELSMVRPNMLTEQKLNPKAWWIL